jgi:FAD/FMN-containing dehydrogenase/Fe-S oxidoreductase
MRQLSTDFITELSKTISGEIKTDPITRVLYSTDASIHKMKPMGVVFPRNSDELIPIVKLAYQYHIPIIPRGSGSSLAGQSIGNGLIIDCSRYLDRIISINPEEYTAIVEPGLILDDLNQAAKKYNLQFGPDPASSERATLGGCIGNNATGAHSIRYGMTADHIISAEVVLADGIDTIFKSVSMDEVRQIAGDPRNASNSIITNIYLAALCIQQEYQDDIRKNWPQTWRRVSGYNLNYLIPWSPTFPPQWELDQIPYPPVLPESINLAQLLVGSEGTLGILRKATLRLVPIRRYSLLSVISFSSIVEACDIVPKILELSPSAIELIPQSLIHLARSVPAYANQLSFAVGDPAALLVVEFSGNNPDELLAQVSKLSNLRNWVNPPVIAETASQQKQVWAVRKVGLGILMSRLGDDKPVTFIEDMSVPVDRLGEFVREMDVILNSYGSQADYYGHASAGCLHIRPLLNIKTQKGRVYLRSIAEAAVELVLRLGGTISSEHGDGITRGEWIERAYGPRIMEAFRMIKQAADSTGILNPGKIVNTPKMDSYLRYDDEYLPKGWTPVMRFSSQFPEPIKLIEAIEQCNGAGVCRKSVGVMCPSYQAIRDEMYSTRGRANLLRAMVADELESVEMVTQAVKDTLDKCLACKGCKAECPSAVDMAKLKYEFYQHYYSSLGHQRPARDYLFGYIALFAKIGQTVAPLTNYLLSNPTFGGLREALVGLSKNRILPRISRIPFHRLANKYINKSVEPDCLLLSDAFNEYFYPQVCIDAIKVLQAAGLKVSILTTIGAGRTLISKGFLKGAKKHAQTLVDEISWKDSTGKLPVIGLEPSEIYTLKDEYLDLLPKGQQVESIAGRAFMIDEFLLRPGLDGLPRISKLKFFNSLKDNRTNVLVHGHCYQKAQAPAKDGYPIGVNATVSMLEEVGYAVKTIDDGCCGMAGAFGYERENYTLSMQIGEISLFPEIKNSNTSIIAASGISCKSQIEDGTGRLTVHPISLVAERGEG